MNVKIKDLPKARHSEMLHDALTRGARALGGESPELSSYRAESMILVGLIEIVTELKQQVEQMTAK